MKQIQIDEKYSLCPDGTLSFPREKAVLLVFYPGDFTPVCTKQLCDYRDNINQFNGLNLDLIGVSKDNATSHGKMRSQYELNFPLISDPEQELLKKFRMKGLVPKRGYALVRKDGLVVWQTTDLLPVFFTNTRDLVKTIKAIGEKEHLFS